MKTTKTFRSLVALLIVFTMVLTMLVGCADNETPTPTPDPNGSGTTETPGDGDNTSTVGITVTTDATTSYIAGDETVALTVTVTGSEDTSYTWSSSPEGILAVENNTVSIVGDIRIDTVVTVTATATADPTKKASKTFIVKAPYIEGQVGNLTSEMLQTLGNASITVEGTLTDYYVDYNQSANNSENKYEMLVEMEEGAWKGVWYISGNPAGAVTNNYRRGDADGIKDDNNNVGHAMEELYINKNNQVAVSTVKNYRSVPAVWEAQHLWNHLGNLNIEKFVYNPVEDRYEYQVNLEDQTDLYLMTYLSISLTPMLSDTLAGLYLIVEDGQITKLVAETEKLLYGEDTSEDPDAMSYTAIELTFSKVGNTEVKEPAPYTAPQYAEVLEAALAKMQANALNYTYKVTDRTVSAPSSDSGDYELASVTRTAYRNSTSSVGTVGSVGYVTPEAVVIADTGEYSYTMDGNKYHTEYTGYKVNGDGTYDEFAYSKSLDAFYGTKKVTGSLADVMPAFDFSANIFEFAGLNITGSGESQYTFRLRETAITRAVAMEISAYKYADDAEAFTNQALTIVVDGDGNLLASTFPYDLVSGTYIGVCTTTYSNIGSTVLEAGAFDNYVPRVVKNTWDLYTVDNYYYLHTNQCSAYNCYNETTKTYDHSAHTASAQKVLEDIFGEDAQYVPDPSLFIGVFGDNLFAPGPFDWKETEDGYIDFFDFTLCSNSYDENMQITNYDELIAALTAALQEKGFTVSAANSGVSGSSTYITYIREGVQIVVENMGTRYFYVTFYQTGDWSLRTE